VVLGGGERGARRAHHARRDRGRERHGARALATVPRPVGRHAHALTPATENGQTTGEAPPSATFGVVRIRTGRLLAGLFVLFAARGCYSSIAPVPRIDPGEDDAGLPIAEPTPDACVPRRPWEGPGVTGVLPVGETTALVLSGER